MIARCLAALAFGLAAFAAGATDSPDAARFEAELTSGKAQIGTGFTLADPTGRKRSLAEFRGKVVVLYFGYTFCPDVCPTDLQEIARALRSLGKRERDVQVLFVTLDPRRDTPELLAQYSAAFHPRILALRGSEEETQRIARAFRIYYQRRETPGASGYAIDHAAYTLLLDRSGKYRDFIPPGTPAARMAVMMEELAAAPK